MTNLKEYGFRENPFSLLPGFHVTNWAGRKEVRLQLLDIAESVLSTDTGLSEFVIIHGSFGAGKSHGLRYLTTLINEVETKRYKAKAIYMPKVKVADKMSFLTLYFQIIQELGSNFFSELAKKIKKRIDKTADELGSRMERKEEKALLQKDPKYFQKRVLESIPSEDIPMIQILLDLSDGKEEVIKYLIEGKPAISGTDFSQPINTDYMAVKVLSYIVRSMTMKIGNQEPAFNGVYLFIDEVEELMEAKPVEQQVFWYAIRELVNRLPYNFALLLALTADAAYLEAIMPMALAERTSRQNIELQALEIKEAKEFIKIHLEDFRQKNFKSQQPFYPFTEGAIDYVLEQIVILVPRKIFRFLRSILERAIRREGLKPEQEIDASMAEEIVVSMGI